jgi:hypothetical protein
LATAGYGPLKSNECRLSVIHSIVYRNIRASKNTSGNTVLQVTTLGNCQSEKLFHNSWHKKTASKNISANNTPDESSSNK